jgi:hypothetical protein
MKIIFADIYKRRSNVDSELLTLVQDANRFISSNRGIIETSPLQVYNSALIFAPTQSLIRELFKNEEPKRITTKSIVETNWNPCLQAIDDRSGVTSAVFLP